MKKLMMAVAAFACAACVQAATVSWTAGNVYEYGSTEVKNSGIAYYMVTSALTLDAAKKLDGKTADDISAALGKAYSWTPATAGTYTKSSGVAVENASLGLKDATNYSAYLVIFDGDTIAESEHFFITSTVDFKTAEGSNNATSNFGNLATSSKNTANWYALYVGGLRK